MSTFKRVAQATTAAALALAATTASAQTNLRIQTHFSQETLSGQMAAEFIEDITGSLALNRCHPPSQFAVWTTSKTGSSAHLRASSR